MCDYCEGRECVGSIVGLDCARDTWVYISEHKGKPSLVIEQDCGSVLLTTSQEINNCPMCGRDLKGETK